MIRVEDVSFAKEAATDWRTTVRMTSDKWLFPFITSGDWSDTGFENIFLVSSQTYFNKRKLPVENVNLLDWQTFVQALHNIAVGNILFPSEAEWEYAGNIEQQAHEVAYKLANELILYDMGGNVWFFYHDWCDAYRVSHVGFVSIILSNVSCQFATLKA